MDRQPLYPAHHHHHLLTHRDFSLPAPYISIAANVNRLHPLTSAAPGESV